MYLTSKLCWWITKNFFIRVVTLQANYFLLFMQIKNVFFFTKSRVSTLDFCFKTHKKKRDLLIITGPQGVAKKKHSKHISKQFLFSRNKISKIILNKVSIVKITPKKKRRFLSELLTKYTRGHDQDMRHFLWLKVIYEKRLFK